MPMTPTREDGRASQIAQRAVDGDAAAEQGSDVFAFKDFRDGDGEAGVDADGVRVAAVAADAGGLRLGAEMFFALRHHSQMPQESACQPMPTRSPVCGP
jgi:hypothetical protein